MSPAGAPTPGGVSLFKPKQENAYYPQVPLAGGMMPHQQVPQPGPASAAAVAPSMSNSEDEHDGDGDDMIEQSGGEIGPVRKRVLATQEERELFEKRIADLTPEEKDMRKRAKNRIAAQKSRQKKSEMASKLANDMAMLTQKKTAIETEMAESTRTNAALLQQITAATQELSYLQNFLNESSGCANGIMSVIMEEGLVAGGPPGCMTVQPGPHGFTFGVCQHCGALHR